jgi:hypothetical protein
MKILWLFVVIVVAAIPSAHAVSKQLGTWKIDVSASNFGTHTPPQSMTLTIFEDTPERSGYRVHRVNRDGLSFSYEWRGTKDGTPSRTVITSDKSAPGAMEAVKEVGGVEIEHGIESDGTLVNGRLSVAPDGQTMTLDVTWTTFEGTEDKQKWVWRKVK